MQNHYSVDFRNMKVSVITVTYNCVELIEPTIQSILQQTYSDIEFIVIDGGSTDGTVDVILKYIDKIDYFVSEPDNGIFDAMNKGLRHATGEWVNFMNAGDSFADENVISDIFSDVNALSGVMLIGGNTNNVFEDGHVEVHYAEPADVIPYHITFSHQACFTRRILSQDEGCFQFDLSYKIAADYNLFYNIYYKSGPDAIKVYNRAIANYRQEGSTSLMNYRKAKGDYLRIQSAHPNLRWWKEVLKYLLQI